MEIMEAIDKTEMLIDLSSSIVLSELVEERNPESSEKQILEKSFKLQNNEYHKINDSRLITKRELCEINVQIIKSDVIIAELTSMLNRLKNQKISQ